MADDIDSLHRRLVAGNIERRGELGARRGPLRGTLVVRVLIARGAVSPNAIA